MAEVLRGTLDKMRGHISLPDVPVSYALPVGEHELPLNPLLGKTLTLQFTGNIFCDNCQRKTKTSFGQGYCYPCFIKLARCDSCIVSPEKCHFEAGTCREPEWGLKNCFIEHIVYIANSSAPKVGITRGTQVPTRWIDQGATQALPVFSVQTRLQSGLVEHIFRDHIGDKTHWRNLLKGDAAPVDMLQLKAQLVEQTQTEVSKLHDRFGVQAVHWLEHAEETRIRYPVLQYPEKIVSLNPEKQPCVSGMLMGIKGQYLIFDTGVINVRKYSSYEVAVSN